MTTVGQGGLVLDGEYRHMTEVRITLYSTVGIDVQPWAATHKNLGQIAPDTQEPFVISPPLVNNIGQIVPTTNEPFVVTT